MPKVKFFYTIRNCGDGSAGVQFHPDAAAAQLACDIEDEGGEAFSENYPSEITLEFDDAGKLLTPSVSLTEMKRALAEIRGEEFDEELDEEEAPKQAFDNAAAKTPVATPADMRPTVAFTGKLSTMTRDEAAQEAEDNGYRFSRYVSSKTDYLVVGENPGSKLTKAQARGMTILSEAEWKDLLYPAAAPAVKATPKGPSR